MNNKTSTIPTLALLTLTLLGGAEVAAQSAEVIQRTYNPISGEPRKVVVVLGDGFQEDGQEAFDEYVDDVIMEAFRSEGFGERLGGYHIVRVNADSNDAGVTLVDATGAVTTARDTALDWRFSGSWGRCWGEPGPNTTRRQNALLSGLRLSPDYVITVLNDRRGGGCRRGNNFMVPDGRGLDHHRPRARPHGRRALRRVRLGLHQSAAHLHRCGARLRQHDRQHQGGVAEMAPVQGAGHRPADLLRRCDHGRGRNGRCVHRRQGTVRPRHLATHVEQPHAGQLARLQPSQLRPPHAGDGGPVGVCAQEPSPGRLRR